MSGSQGCAGVLPEQSAETWECDLCENEKSLESSLVRLSHRHSALFRQLNCPQDQRCLLCMLPCAGVDVNRTYLRICKPTEGRNWVHLCCAIFSPDLLFADSGRLCLVEGLSTIPQWRRTTVSVFGINLLPVRLDLQAVRKALCPLPYSGGCDHQNH